MQRIKNFLSYLNSFSRRSKIIGGVIAVIVLIVLFHLGGGEPAADVATSATHVELASVASLSSGGGPLPVVGKVTSVSQASISALSGGEITGLRVKLGDRVGAGQVIASFENSSQQAAVLQAQGQYDAAVASQRAVSPQDTRAEAINTFRTSFSTLDTILETEIDTFYGTPGPYGPQLLIAAPMYDYGELSRDRVRIRQLIEEYRNRVASGSGEPAELLTYGASVVAQVSSFADKLAVAANGRNSRATDEQVAAIASARSGLGTLAATFASAIESYRSGSITTTSSTDASVTIALGGLRAAQAALEKTYVRAPISGTIVSLPVNRGDFVSPGTQVAIISNPGALQVEAYVTSADAKTLSVGGKATIDETVPGTIVFIAPALDPLTGKIQVKVSPSSISGAGQGSLTDGSTVTVLLDRVATRAVAKNTISIPIAAAKMTPQGAVVFTVASSTLVAHSVTLGAIQGGQVEITQGVTADMDIVVDARGLSEGQVVVVDQE